MTRSDIGAGAMTKSSLTPHPVPMEAIKCLRDGLDVDLDLPS